jgi:hypothetical protein
MAYVKTELGPLRARRGSLTEALKRRTLPGNRREPHARVEDAPQRIYPAAWLGKKLKSSAFRWSWISLSRWERHYTNGEWRNARFVCWCDRVGSDENSAACRPRYDRKSGPELLQYLAMDSDETHSE